MALYIFTGDGVVHYRIVDLYWGRSSLCSGHMQRDHVHIRLVLTLNFD